ncbi:hypothetical protein ACFRNT_14295 [Streptomyces sp. NPDC056697]|uniref:hypothetical protein n=1 Tax=Streptomyces sp. NPDC056697 TaxID=3345915 RepID=UPI0036750E4C
MREPSDPTSPAPEDTCYIRSTIDDHGRAACLLQWGPVTSLLTPTIVITTGRHLMAAATTAETDIALIESLRADLRLPDDVLASVLAAIRERRPAPEGRAALRIAAVAGAKTGKPLVHIARGSMTGQLDPDQARAMATQWLQTATAAHIDIRLRYALGEWGHLDPTQIERLFTIVQGLDR